MPPKRNQWKKVENPSEFLNFKHEEKKPQNKKTFCDCQMPVVYGHSIELDGLQCYICSKTIKDVNYSMEIYERDDGPLWSLSKEELNKVIEKRERYIELRLQVDVSNDVIRFNEMDQDQLKFAKVHLERKQKKEEEKIQKNNLSTDRKIIGLDKLGDKTKKRLKDVFTPLETTNENMSTEEKKEVLMRNHHKILDVGEKTQTIFKDFDHESKKIID